MQLTLLKLTNFKNYEQATIEPAARLNAFVGPNGAGKTNLLESIYYLCMGKAHDSRLDTYAMRHGEDFFRLDSRFEDPDHRIVVKAVRKKRKVIEKDGNAYERLADHVGLLPVVLVTPEDSRIVQEGSELRRRLMDNALSQVDGAYLQNLLLYNQLLKQRNALLKSEHPDFSLLDVYDARMADPAAYIHQKRKSFCPEFSQLVIEAHTLISGGEAEQIGLTYKCHLSESSWADLMQSRRDKDRILQRTTAGIHRDDLVFEQGEHPAKRVASQGQLKSFVLALKLAQYHLLKEQTGRKPILLLDDIFDKLDQRRVGSLLQLLMANTYGQIFISDTDADRVAQLVDMDSENWALWEVESGRIDQINL
ncbi:MAG: DNA replication and repair protein RecF [Bacteroidota bacterium]